LGFGFGRYRRRDARVVIPDFLLLHSGLHLLVFVFYFVSLPSSFTNLGVRCGVHLRCFLWLCLFDTWLDLCARLALDGVLLSSLTALCFATTSSP
jgi:hypothetical protein